MARPSPPLVLLDANIIISHLLAAKEGSPVTVIVRAAARGELRLLLPVELVEELATKVRDKPYLAERIAPEDAEELLSALATLAEVLPGLDAPIPALTRDPKDDYLIACAVVADADYIITGDNDLLTLERIGNLRILSPRQFVESLPSNP